MEIYQQLIFFWSNLLYGNIVDLGYDSVADLVQQEIIDSYFYNSPIQTNIKEGLANLLNWIPHCLTILTFGLAIFLFCYMLYKIIKLFTNTI